MINVGIIGTGSIARLHEEAYREFPKRCRVVRLADIAPGKAAKFGKERGLDAAASDRWEDAAEDAGVDLVSICVPPFEHARVAIGCLRAGKHVILEKPMAASLKECDAILEEAARAGTVFSPVAQNRFRSTISRFKEVLDGRLAGNVVHAQVDSFWWRGRSYYDLWWRGLWEKEGGGCTLNHAVHHIDMLIWMLGLPRRVTSVLTNAAHDNAEVEDLSVSILEYEKDRLTVKGALAQVTASVTHHGEEQQLVFQCEKARLSIPWKVYASTAQPNGFPVRNEPLEAALEEDYMSREGLSWEGHAGQIEDVLSAIEHKRRPLIGGEDGRNTIELITAIYKAGASGVPVTLPLAKSDPFYTAEGIMKAAPRFYKKSAAVEELSGGITTGGNYGDR